MCNILQATTSLYTVCVTCVVHVLFLSGETEERLDAVRPTLTICHCLSEKNDYILIPMTVLAIANRFIVQM